MTSTTHGPVLPDGDHRGGAEGAVGVGPGREEPASSPNGYSSPSAPPFDAGEFDRINAALWDKVWKDPGRVEELLSIAVGALGSMAIHPGHVCKCPDFTKPDPTFALCQVHGPYRDNRAEQALRRMLQRVLLGATHEEQEDHR